MSFRPTPSTQSRQGSRSNAPLSIRLPSSPSLTPVAVSTPTNLTHPAFPTQVSSPRRAPLPPSPSPAQPYTQAPWMNERSRSLDVPRNEQQSSRDKRLPLLPSSPHKGGATNSYVGAYDNKLASCIPQIRWLTARSQRPSPSCRPFHRQATRRQVKMRQGSSRPCLIRLRRPLRHLAPHSRRRHR